MGPFQNGPIYIYIYISNFVQAFGVEEEPGVSGVGRRPGAKG